METKHLLLGLTVIIICAVALSVLFAPQPKPKTQDTYQVSTYVAYYGNWTILKIDDPNRQTSFYLAYHRTTHKTYTDTNISNLIKTLS